MRMCSSTGSTAPSTASTAQEVAQRVRRPARPLPSHPHGWRSIVRAKAAARQRETACNTLNFHASSQQSDSVSEPNSHFPPETPDGSFRNHRGCQAAKSTDEELRRFLSRGGALATNRTKIAHNVFEQALRPARTASGKYRNRVVREFNGRMNQPGQVDIARISARHNLGSTVCLNV